MTNKLVTCYVNPDLDGFACSIGYCEFLQKNGEYAVPGIFGVLDEETQFLLHKYHIDPPQGEMNPEYYDLFVLVDASIMSGIDRRIDPLKVVEIIDHRTLNDVKLFPNAKVQIEEVGSAATLVVERFFSHNLKPSRISGVLLAGAIISNTLNFKARITTQRDRDMFAWLGEVIGERLDLAQSMFEAKSDFTGSLLEKKMDNNFAFFTFKNKNIGYVQLEALDIDTVVQNRKEDVINYALSLKESAQLDHILVSFVGLDKGYNLIITPELETQKMLEGVLVQKFIDYVLKTDSLWLRKEIMPKLKKLLERE